MGAKLREMQPISGELMRIINQHESTNADQGLLKFGHNIQISFNDRGFYPHFFLLA
jgi:hypothetical protein